MNRSIRIGAVVAALVLTAGGLVEHTVQRAQRARLDTVRAEVRAAEAAVRQARSRLGATIEETREIPPSRHAASETSPARLWASRVHVLQQLLAELPAQRLPEQRLLDALDWIEIVRDTELDTPSRLRDALAGTRAAGRQKFAKLLQEALRRFTEESGGKLPDGINELARFLKAPADDEMLARYHLTRSGQIGSGDEALIVENSDSDMILSVGLTSWNMSNGSKLLPAPDEDEMAALARAAGAMGATAAGEAGEMAGEYARNLRVLLENIKPQLESTFGETFEGDMKQAIKRFVAEHPNEKPANFGQIAPYLATLDQVVAALRPVLVQLEYMSDHQGRLPADPAQLRPYLDRPFDPQRAFRGFKLDFSADGEHGSMSFSFGSK